MPNQSSLFRRLMLGFGIVIISVAILGMAYVLYEAKANQRLRTANENKAHTREILAQMIDIADDAEKLRHAASMIEKIRNEMYRELDFHSLVRLQIWKNQTLIYNSQPQLPTLLPEPGTPGARHANAWVRWVEKDVMTGITVERSHEVDDEWMLTMSGVSFLLSSTVFSLPLLLLPAWLIVGIGLRPLRSIAAEIEQRTESDLTALPDSKYRELSPLVSAINHLMLRLQQRIENEHEFLTDAAHELKTPLAAIQINAHLLLSRSAVDPTTRSVEAGQGLRDGVARATHMVHQLLALERARAEPSSHTLPLTELGSFVRDRLASVAPFALQRGIEIEFQTDTPCMHPVHLESMGALLDNLISNAIKYSPENGLITVNLITLESGFRLTITDQGPGIDLPLQQKVFERFYRIPGQEQVGSGLGLAIAERAAARNQGRISLANNTSAQGLIVTIDFNNSTIV
jgi:two-component system sensor histidine kinase QseC